MSDLTARMASVQTSIAAIRKDVPAIEWRAGQMLAALSELAAILGDLVATDRLPGEVHPVCEEEQHNRDTRRRATVDHLLWLACRSLPADGHSSRDSEVPRILTAWGVTSQELLALGYRGKNCGGVAIEE